MLAHNPLSSLAYPMITHIPLVAGNFPIKTLVARQWPTNHYTCMRSVLGARNRPMILNDENIRHDSIKTWLHDVQSNFEYVWPFWKHQDTLPLHLKKLLWALSSSQNASNFVEPGFLLTSSKWLGSSASSKQLVKYLFYECTSSGDHETAVMITWCLGILFQCCWYFKSHFINSSTLVRISLCLLQFIYMFQVSICDSSIST